MRLNENHEVVIILPVEDHDHLILAQVTGTSVEPLPTQVILPIALILTAVVLIIIKRFRIGF